MEDDRRFGRELYRFRLAALGAVAFLLPLVMPLAWQEGVALAMMAPAALAWWAASTRWMGPGARNARVLGVATLLEALAIALFVAGYGGPRSPFLLLYLPLAVQAAGALSLPGAALAGAYMAIGATAAIAPVELRWPAWGLVPVAAATLVAGLLAWWGWARRRAARRERARARRLAEVRLLLAKAASPGDPERFWAALARAVAADGRFAGAAVLRWTGAGLQASATSRPEAWRGLGERHARRLRERIASGTPEVFAERAGGRTIVCWPIPRHPGAIGPVGMLGVLVAPGRPATLAAVWPHLERWLPLTGLALAALEPRLTLRRTRVDWHELVDATVRRMDRRLSGYLVMIDVDQGQVEADAALLGDAVAHLVEEVLDRVPHGSRVRIAARRDGAGWRFTVETEAPAGATPPPPGPGLQLARQVVAAHGGRWEARSDGGTRSWGFRLPAVGVVSPES